MPAPEILLETSEVRVTRQARPERHELSLLKHVFVEWGSKADWVSLCELHYKGHSLAAGSRFMRCVLREPGEPERLVGVMVMANPQPLSKGRNVVFPRLRPNADGRDNRMINQTRMRWINENITWNNRTVLDTMYRSAGIAYRFKNLAYRMYCQRYSFKFVESVSSMGRFNPFSIKSGMKFVKPKTAAALEDGIRFFNGHFSAALDDIEAVREELAAMPAERQAYVERRLREFYYRWSSMEKSGDKRDLGMTRINGLSVNHVLKEVMQLIFSATVYWLWQAVDAQELPKSMPITAFDEQGPNEPLARAWGGPGDGEGT